MSNLENSLLIEWASEIMEEMTGTYVERALHQAIEDNDLMEVRRLVATYAPEASRMHFNNHDLIGDNDVY